MSLDAKVWAEKIWKAGTAEAKAGEKQFGLIEYGSSADGSVLASPVCLVIGREVGPRLYIQAAVHGNELNGIESLRRVLIELDPLRLRGALIVVPVVNSSGFVQDARRNQFDREDMNRVWPGKASGQASQQATLALYQEAVSQADYIIDLHTAGAGTLLHVVYGQGDPASRALAVAFGLEILLEEPVNDDWKQARFAGKLRNVAAAKGIPSITPELGGVSTFEESSIMAGVRGLHNVMKHLGMLEGEQEHPKQQITLIGSHLDQVRARQGGLFVTKVQPGDQVKEGQELGFTYSIRDFGIVETFRAPYAAIILSVTTRPVVNTGTGVVSLGIAGGS